MQAHILSLHTPSVPGVWSKCPNIFPSESSCVLIKLKGMEHRAPHKHIFCPYTHPLPLGFGQNIFSSESSRVENLIKGNGA